MAKADNNSSKHFFKKGMARLPNAGRVKGKPNKVTRMIKEAAIIAASEVGEIQVIEILRKDGGKQILRNPTGKDAMVGYFRYCAVYHTNAYLTLLAKILPAQHQVTHSSEEAYRSVAEVEKELLERGVTLSALTPMLLEGQQVGQNEFDAVPSEFDARSGRPDLDDEAA